jgi:hypothetical protein
MAKTTRNVTAETRIYLPGGSHGFQPGDTVPLPASVEAALLAAGHLTAPAAVTPAPDPEPVQESPGA